MSEDKEIDQLAGKPGLVELVQALKDIAEKIERRPRLIGAIADPTTTHEAFYSMLFGEVSELLHQLQTLEETLPALNRDLLVSAMNGLSGKLDPVFGQVEENIKRQLEATVAESEKISQFFARQTLTLQTQLKGMSDLNIEQLALDIRNAAELRSNTQQVMQKAAAAMTESAQKLDQAAEQVNSGKGLRLFVLVAALGCAGIFGGFVGGYVAVNSLVHPVEQTYRR